MSKQNRFALEKEGNETPFVVKKYTLTPEQLIARTKGCIKVDKDEWFQIPNESRICAIKKDGSFLVGGWISLRSKKKNSKKFLIRTEYNKRKKGNMQFWIDLNDFTDMYMRIHNESYIEIHSIMKFVRFQTKQNEAFKKEIISLRKRVAALESKK